MAIGIRRKTPQIIERGAPLRARFTENLKPGLTYQVKNRTLKNFRQNVKLSMGEQNFFPFWQDGMERKQQQRVIDSFKYSIL